jgi:lambda repressor-like predicted transcriptional regulator
MTPNQRRWGRRVAAWKASGLTLRSYAAKAGVNPKTLAWWQWRLRRMTEGAAADFVEVTDAVQRGAGEALLVRLGGAEIEVPDGFDEETFARVLRVLGAGA